MSKQANDNKQDKTPKTRSSNIELDKRIDAIIGWILEGHNTSIIKASCVSTWSITDRQAATYISKARKVIKTRTKGKLDEKIAFHLEIRLRLYNQLKDKSTPSGAAAALKILDSMAEIDGVKQRAGFGKKEEEGSILHDEVIETTLVLK